LALKETEDPTLKAIEDELEALLVLKNAALLLDQTEEKSEQPVTSR